MSPVTFLPSSPLSLTQVELAVIIGKKGKDIEETNAMRSVFGFAVANDVTARDVQKKHGGQWFKVKVY